jgi:hypothetical protein
MYNEQMGCVCLHIAIAFICSILKVNDGYRT